MLEPKVRIRLMEQLRPPDGFRLDRAIGTTFSLDLLSLLIAPLSMALFECEDKEVALKDLTAVLEALRQMKDRIAVFCQKGRIMVPKAYNYLFSYLEPMVVEVAPKNQEGVFHPKVWLIRFLNDKKEIYYRFICLSRNLTFDRSWDTILTLDGIYASERKLAFSINRPLSDFLNTLPDLSQNISQTVKDNVKRMADEVLRVRFEPPEPFEEISFHPIGIAGYKSGPDIYDCKRSLVISPFLSEEMVEHLTKENLVNEEEKNVLVSRPESLDGLKIEVLNRLEKTINLFIMEQAAERPADNEPDVLDKEEILYEEDLDGLHAKLYVLEKGWNVSIFTGSANTTTAGLKGVNVEFLTELQGKKSIVGIDRLLGRGKDSPEMSLGNLLIPYKIPVNQLPSDDNQKRLEEALEKIRRRLSSICLSAKVIPNDDKKYTIELVAGEVFTFPDNTNVTCWPIMLKGENEKDITILATGKSLTFTDMTLLDLTSFFAFKVITRVADIEGMLKFVLKLPVEGMPEEERNRGILLHIIGDRERFIRYLLFQLSEDPERSITEGILKDIDSRGNNESRNSPPYTPLLEEMVRAYSRSPEKLNQIDKLVMDLKNTEDGGKVLPEGFEEIWSAFKLAVSMKENEY